MDGKSRSYMRAVCAVLAAGLLTAGCGKEETAAAETAEIAVPEAAKRAEGSETMKRGVSGFPFSRLVRIAASFVSTSVRNISLPASHCPYLIARR